MIGASRRRALRASPADRSLERLGSTVRR